MPRTNKPSRRVVVHWSSYLSVAACLTMLPPTYIWVQHAWRQGVFGGIGSAFLTPFIAVLLSCLSIRRAKQAPSHQASAGVHIALALFSATGGGILLLSDGLSLSFAILVLIWPPWFLACIDLLFGASIRKQLTFSILFLWFVFPFEPLFFDHLDTPLQSITTDISVWLLNVAGYGVKYWNAYTFYTDEFYIIVDETCSGFNLLVTLSMYALVFGWATRRTMVDRIVLCLSVLPLALLSNGVRVAAIYLLGLHGGKALAFGFWHEASGVLAFLPTLFGIYAIGEGLLLLRRKHANAHK